MIELNQLDKRMKNIYIIGDVQSRYNKKCLGIVF